MSQRLFDPLETASYYDDPDVSTFYRHYWGGEDIHIGLYDAGDESVAEASAKMTRYLLEHAGTGPGQKVLDIACGFGGTLRILARMGCRATGFDISNVCVTEALRANEEAGLANRITVSRGDFHAIDSPNDQWDAVVCQEALIHSDDRLRVFNEVYRVLRPGGVFAFSDILTGDGADVTLVRAAFSRLGAEAGATVDNYCDLTQQAGFDIRYVEERHRDIESHYAVLARALDEPVEGLSSHASASIKQSIARWRAATAGGHITWALFIARKPGL